MTEEVEVTEEVVEEEVEQEPQGITRADLNKMTPEQINTARLAGDLDHLLGRAPKPSPGDTITRDDLANLTPDQIVAALKAGRLNHLTNGL
ncbi:hypothetical protein ACTU6V_12460 [Microbacterium sp. A204]|uniref:hypothetical protein n=1 Tax=Microbacterium sp. A204 TaxID=3457321 RepID=UPI003FD26116